jgi:urease accessory protein
MRRRTMGRGAFAGRLVMAGWAAGLTLWTPLALAHADHGHPGGFLAGLAHPVLGIDHLVAMVAVGLWGAILKAPALWLLPVTFPLVMAMGGALGILGVPLGHVEPAIAASALALGLLVAFMVRLPLAVAAILVGLFALFHGHAHGTELPDSASPFAYALGFVIATGGLHLAGMALGLLLDWRGAGTWIVRGTGVVVALIGVAFLVG